MAAAANSTCDASTAALSSILSTVRASGSRMFGWDVEEALAAGESAVVYRARRGQRPAALKVFASRRGARVSREASLTEVARVAGAPAVLSHGMRSDGVSGLVLELIAGRTLQQHWASRGRRFDVLTALTIIDRVLAALNRLHAAGIIHRDVHPRNVLITDDGDVRLIDYGAAAREGESDVRAAPSSPYRPAYDETPCETTDLYSVAAILHALVGGAPPSRGSVTLSPERVPAELLQLLECALAMPRERRFVNALHMRSAIASLLAHYQAAW